MSDELPFSAVPKVNNYCWFRDYEVLEYCPNADAYMWMRPIASRLPTIICTTIIVLLLLGVTNTADSVMYFLAHTLLSPLKPLLVGTPDPAISQVIATISYCANWFYVLLGIAVAYHAMEAANSASHIAITPVALTMARKAKVWYVPNKIMAWPEIETIYLERPKGKRSTRDYRICFLSISGKTLKVRYGDIVNEWDRSRFLAAIRMYAARQCWNEEELACLEPVKERQCYTELWLKELSAAPKRDKLTPLSPEAVLQNGQYVVHAKVGMGGQGTVYLARKCDLGASNEELVALKEFVLPVMADPLVRRKVAERFQAEAQMLAKLDHHQIVRYIDLFIEDHRAYLVLERAEGINLRKQIAAGGRLSEDTVIDCALQMCDILAYLHGQDPPIVHRDFAPDNLMLASGGALKLIDFSVAQQTESNVTGTVVGKHNYMSPEQFRGKPTTQSDVYSLGATIFFLLTGEEPEAISTLHPRTVNADLSQALDDLVSRCTKIDVDKRYQSISAVQEDLLALRDSTRVSDETKTPVRLDLAQKERQV